MQEYELCCVGHITLDKVTTPKNTVHMPGGTSFYCAHAVRHLSDIKFKLVAGLAQSEISVVEDLQSKGIDVHTMLCKHSVYFENIYGENQDNRTQRVLAKADPFTVDALKDINAKIYLLGSLLADDFSVDVVKYLSEKGLVAIDSQGYLREVKGTEVHATDWDNKKEVLKYVHFLKANEDEMEALTGYTDIRKAAQTLHSWGVKEVLITMGSMGSIIYDGTDYFQIPAYEATEVIDATGCGDTYITGYLYKRAKGLDIKSAGKFGAAMATMKIEHIGPFNDSEDAINTKMTTAKQHNPKLI